MIKYLQNISVNFFLVTIALVLSFCIYISNNIMIEKINRKKHKKKNQIEKCKKTKSENGFAFTRLCVPVWLERNIRNITTTKNVNTLKRRILTLL